MDFILPIFSIIILLIVVYLFISKNNKHNYKDEYDLLVADSEAKNLKLAVTEQEIVSLQRQHEAIINLLEKNREQSDLLLNTRIEKLELDKITLQDLIAQQKKHLIQAEAGFDAQQEKLTQQKTFINETQIRFKTEFENVANQILKEKTAEFTQVNKLNLDTLLNPLKENIKAFEEKVDRSYKTESAERFTLKGTIDELIKQTKLIQDDASNLTRALKGDNKKQGNWGEMVLDKLLEGSGLLENVNYTKQTSYTAEDGSKLLPDIVLHLPDEKSLIIDSKVSLIAYEKLVNTPIDDEKLPLTKLHVAAIKNHITSLSGKNYHDLYQINSPEFVLLFIPIESSFAIAVQFDQDLFDYAWKRKVVIVTPSTLLATLKTIASIWKQETQTKNAIEIADRAGKLYDKFVGFIADLQRVGESLDKSQKAYGDAMSKLTSGSGNLVSRVETLRKLGAKTTKEIDSHLLED